MALLKIGVAAAALALALATIRAGEAGEATLGGAAAASGRYFGAALDPDALDERPYRDLAATQLTCVPLAAQADDYASVVRACRETPRCVGVTTWGITDDRSWVPSFFSGYGAALPFDENYRPKPAVAAIIDGFTEKAP